MPRPRPDERQRVVPVGAGPITSRNRAVAGSEYSANNAANSLIYDPSASGNTYNHYFRNIPPDHLLFLLFDNPYIDPIDNPPTIEGHTISEIQQGSVSIPFDRGNKVIIKRQQKFTDGKKHDVIAVEHEGKKYKVKFAGTDPTRNGFPYFYIEVFYQGAIHKAYGDFSNTGASTDFGKKKIKQSSEMKYLKSLFKNIF